MDRINFTSMLNLFKVCPACRNDRHKNCWAREEGWEPGDWINHCDCSCQTVREGFLTMPPVQWEIVSMPEATEDWFWWAEEVMSDYALWYEQEYGVPL